MVEQKRKVTGPGLSICPLSLPVISGARGREEGDMRERGVIFFPKVVSRYQVSWKLLIMTTSYQWEGNNFLEEGAAPHTLAAEQSKSNVNKLYGHKKARASF